jgi:hypothetical protein
MTKIIVALLFALGFGFTLEAQIAEVFEYDRFIPINNPIKNAYRISVHIKVQSLSESQDPEKYECFFSSTNRKIELADHMGKLAFYDGEKWISSEVNVRDTMRNITLTFKGGLYKVFSNNQRVMTGGRIKGDPYFQCKGFYLGASYEGEGFFKGIISQVGFYNYGIKQESLATLDQSKRYMNFPKDPVVKIDFESGFVKFNGLSDNQLRIPEEVGKISEDEKDKVLKFPHHDMLTIHSDLRDKKAIYYSNRGYVFTLEGNSVSGLKGSIRGKEKFLPEGEYIMKILGNGKVEISQMITTDRN